MPFVAHLGLLDVVNILRHDQQRLRQIEWDSRAVVASDHRRSRSDRGALMFLKATADAQKRNERYCTSELFEDGHRECSRVWLDSMFKSIQLTGSTPLQDLARFALTVFLRPGSICVEPGT